MEDAATELLQAVQPKRKQGIVQWFNDSLGYGFIEPRDGGANIFCHQSEIRTRGFRTLSPDQTVEFDVEDHPKGPRAVNIVPLQVKEYDYVRSES